MKLKLFLIFSLLLLFPFLSAGLQIEGDPVFSENKTYGSPKTIQFQITNTEAFTFVNITFEDNDVISIPTIASLPSASSINVTATIISDVDFSGVVKLEGLYFSNIGQNYETHNVDVDYEDGLSQCAMSIIEGDSLNWTNFVSDDIEIVAPYPIFGNNIIPEGESKVYNFPTPEEFSYYFERRSLPFTDTCTITVKSSNGYVHDPQKDADLNLNVNILYPETSISVNVLENNHEIEVFEEKEGILSITNTGNETVRNLQMNGEWFSFSENNFDMAPGATKGIVYKIKPILSEANQTNQSYTKALTFEGNFPTYSHNFDIFIPFKDISEDGGSSGGGFLEWYNNYCPNHPEEEICGGGTTIVIQNESQQLINFTMTQEQFDNLIKFQFEESDLREEFENYMKEQMDSTEENVNSMDTRVTSLEAFLREELFAEITKLKEIVSAVLGLISLTLTGFGLFRIRKYHIKKGKFNIFAGKYNT